MLLIIIIMIYGSISRMNVVHIAETVQTDTLCSETPKLAATHMRSLDKSWMNKLGSVNEDGWTFWKVKTTTLCNISACSFWDNITFKRKHKTLVYIWKSEVEMADKSREDVAATCYLQNGWRFGSRWITIYDQSSEYGPTSITDSDVWFHYSDKAIPFFEDS